MYSRDYILRLIQQFARALIALRNHLLGREADPADALAQISEIAREAGLDLEIARTLDTSSLLMWLAPTTELDPSRMWLMAELLYLAALTSGATGRADLERALAICQRLPADWKPSDDFPTVGERVTEIRELLERPDSGA
jgi:hypothetical protein